LPVLLPLLLTLTVLTGVVDAVSYLRLGHVFVANMTGNIVFLGFSFGGQSGLSATASLTALGAFLLGSGLGGALARRLGGRPVKHLAAAATLGLAPVTGALLLAAADSGLGGATHYAITALLGSAMGLQNVTARKLAVPDATTTVLTMTLTGLAADAPTAALSQQAKRVASVLAMLLGALIGTVLVRQASVAAALGLALALLVSVAAAATAASHAAS
jgi:uncharacterized membrane protein YoaK (UPF0700 family)